MNLNAMSSNNDNDVAKGNNSRTDTDTNDTNHYCDESVDEDGSSSSMTMEALLSVPMDVLFHAAPQQPSSQSSSLSSAANINTTAATTVAKRKHDELLVLSNNIAGQGRQTTSAPARPRTRRRRRRRLMQKEALTLVRVHLIATELDVLLSLATSLLMHRHTLKQTIGEAVRRSDSSHVNVVTQVVVAMNKEKDDNESQEDDCDDDESHHTPSVNSQLQPTMTNTKTSKQLDVAAAGHGSHHSNSQQSEQSAVEHYHGTQQAPSFKDDVQEEEERANAKHNGQPQEAVATDGDKKDVTAAEESAVEEVKQKQKQRRSIMPPRSLSIRAIVPILQIHGTSVIERQLQYVQTQVCGLLRELQSLSHTLWGLAEQNLALAEQLDQAAESQEQDMGMDLDGTTANPYPLAITSVNNKLAREKRFVGEVEDMVYHRIEQLLSSLVLPAQKEGGTSASSSSKRKRGNDSTSMIAVASKFKTVDIFAGARQHDCESSNISNSNNNTGIYPDNTGGHNPRPSDQGKLKFVSMADWCRDLESNIFGFVLPENAVTGHPTHTATTNSAERSSSSKDNLVKNSTTTTFGGKNDSSTFNTSTSKMTMISSLRSGSLLTATNTNNGDGTTKVVATGTPVKGSPSPLVKRVRIQEPVHVNVNKDSPPVLVRDGPQAEQHNNDTDGSMSKNASPSSTRSTTTISTSTSENGEIMKDEEEEEEGQENEITHSQVEGAALLRGLFRN
jgi:hypothetical protein